MPITRLHRRLDAARAYCFNIESTRPLTDEELRRLRLLLADGFIAETVSLEPVLTGERVVEVGPRLNFATAWSSNLVSICRATGLDCVTRAERSRVYVVPEGEDVAAFIAAHHDRMTECHYKEPLTTFETGIKPEPVYEVDLLGKGPDALLNLPGISMDERDRLFYYDYFVGKHQRNPTIVEIMDLNNANSEHSRHGYFRGRQVVDGVEQDGHALRCGQGNAEGQCQKFAGGVRRQQWLPAKQIRHSRRQPLPGHLSSSSLYTGDRLPPLGLGLPLKT